MGKKEKKKVNLIDLLVFIAAAVVIVGMALKMSGLLEQDPKKEEEEKQGANVVYTITLENIDKKIYENIKSYIDAAKKKGEPGEQMMADNKLVKHAYITNVEATEREEVFEIAGDGATYLVLYPAKKEHVDIKFTCEAYVEDDVITRVGTQEVRIGRGYFLQSTHFELTGVVVSCEWTEVDEPPVDPSESPK